MITIPISVQTNELRQLQSSFDTLERSIDKLDLTLDKLNSEFVEFQKKSTESLSQSSSSMKRFGDQAKRAQSQTTRFFTSFSLGLSDLRTGLSGRLGPVALFSAVTVGAKEAAESVVRFSLETETAFARLGTISGDLSLGRIEEQLIDLSRTVPQSLGNLTEAAFTAVSAGVRETEDDLTEFLRISAQLATVAGSDTNTAVNALARTIQGFSLDMSEAADVADIFFQITDKGIAPTKELAEFFPELAAGANVAGISLRETAQAFAAISRVQGVARAKTALDQLFSTLTVTTPASKELSEALGIDLSKSGIEAAGGLVPFINRIRDVTNENPVLIKGLVRTRRAFNALSLLTGPLNDEFNNLSDSFLDIESTAGKADEAFLGFSKTGAVQLDLAVQALQTSFKGFGDSIVDFALPAIREFTDFVNNTSEIDQQIRALKELGVAGEALQSLEDASRLEKTNQALKDIRNNIERIRNERDETDVVRAVNIDQVNAAREADRQLRDSLARTALTTDGLNSLEAIREVRINNITRTIEEQQRALAASDADAIIAADEKIERQQRQLRLVDEFLEQARLLGAIQNNGNKEQEENNELTDINTKLVNENNDAIKTSSRTCPRKKTGSA